MPVADAAPAAPAPVVSTMPLREQIIDKQARAYATGRRKDAVARVWVKPGSGKDHDHGRDQEVFSRAPRCASSSPGVRRDRARGPV